MSIYVDDRHNFCVILFYRFSRLISDMESYAKTVELIDNAVNTDQGLFSPCPSIAMEIKPINIFVTKQHTSLAENKYQWHLICDK